MNTLCGYVRCVVCALAGARLGDNPLIGRTVRASHCGVLWRHSMYTALMRPAFEIRGRPSSDAGHNACTKGHAAPWIHRRHNMWRGQIARELLRHIAPLAVAVEVLVQIGLTPMLNIE